MALGCSGEVGIDAGLHDRSGVNRTGAVPRGGIRQQVHRLSTSTAGAGSGIRILSSAVGWFDTVIVCLPTVMVSLESAMSSAIMGDANSCELIAGWKAELVVPTDQSVYAPWHLRVSARLIDLLFFVVLFGIGVGLAWGINHHFKVDIAVLLFGEDILHSKPRTHHPTGIAGMYLMKAERWVVKLMLITVIVLVAVNRVLMQGRTGRSLGKLVVGLRVVDPRTHHPVGIGRMIMRQLACIIDVLPCGLGFLLPLFDTHRRTIADMMTNAIVIRDRNPVPLRTEPGSIRDHALWWAIPLCTVATYVLITIAELWGATL